jgi:hypothetical protein
MGAVEVNHANRLEALTGDLAGKWSIRVNDRWRLCFRFEHGHAYDVEIVDFFAHVWLCQGDFSPCCATPPRSR